MFLLWLQSWGRIEHTVSFLYTIFLFMVLYLHLAAALHKYIDIDKHILAYTHTDMHIGIL